MVNTRNYNLTSFHFESSGKCATIRMFNKKLIQGVSIKTPKPAYQSLHQRRTPKEETLPVAPQKVLGTYLTSECLLVVNSKLINSSHKPSKQLCLQMELTAISQAQISTTYRRLLPANSFSSQTKGY